RYDDRWNAANRARVMTCQLPAVVPAATVRDDVSWDVLHDQIAASDAERGALIERQPSRGRRVPPDNVVSSVGKSMQPRTDRRYSSHFVVRPLEHGVFRLEGWTTRPTRRRPSRGHRRVQGAIQRAEPAAVPRSVAEHGDHQQV